MIGIVVFWGLYWGPPILENYHKVPGIWEPRMKGAMPSRPRGDKLLGHMVVSQNRGAPI